MKSLKQISKYNQNKNQFEFEWKFHALDNLECLPNWHKTKQEFEKLKIQYELKDFNFKAICLSEKDKILISEYFSSIKEEDVNTIRKEVFPTNEDLDRYKF